MYWLQRPPYLRRAGAVLLVAVALVWDLSSGTTEPYPVAARSIAAGSPISPADIEWIALPAAHLPIPELSEAMAAVDIPAGDPISRSVVAGPVTVPEGWWVLPVVVGTLAVPGDEVLLVIADPPITVIGLVLSSQVGDPYDLEHTPAAVAVPPDSAPLIAAAQDQGLLVTAVRPAATGG